MLERTFSHVPGVGRTTEAALWNQGCHDWTCYLSEPDRYKIGGASRDIFTQTITRSQRALEEGEHQYFARALTAADAWRAWPAFKDKCLYLDIETDGGPFGSSITVIGMYDGAQFKALIQDQDLEAFRDEISKYSMVVTFFGSGFDIPMLQKRFRGQWFDHIHLDLCFALKRLGYRGGLKKIEAQLGIVRAANTLGLSGQDAIFLWNRHLRGDPTALQTLVDYNREDVINMERLANIAYEGLLAQALGGVVAGPMP